MYHNADVGLADLVVRDMEIVIAADVDTAAAAAATGTDVMDADNTAVAAVVAATDDDDDDDDEHCPQLAQLIHIALEHQQNSSFDASSYHLDAAVVVVHYFHHTWVW